MINDPIVIEFQDGTVYGGRVDDYYYDGGGIVSLYYCKLLDKSNHKWVDHDVMIELEGKLVRDSMPSFWTAAIKDIFVLPEEYREEFTLDDILQIYIDPHYKPLTGVECTWGNLRENGKNKENHSSKCDARLHEALSILYMRAIFGSDKQDKDQGRKIREAFRYIRRRLLLYGAKIP